MCSSTFSLPDSAFSLDGLAMALHAFYHTSNFNDAIVRVINFCGDSDSTGSICGQVRSDWNEE